MIPTFLPGGPEIFFGVSLLVFYLALPILFVVAIYNFLDGKRGYDKRISMLEDRVAELENDLELID